MKTRAAVLYKMEHSAPYANSKPLVIETLDLVGPGPGEVLVEIWAAGLCHSDLSVIDGSRPRVMPMVMGHEASGIVRDVGEGVDTLKPEDHVVFSFVPMCGHCIPCSTGRPVLCENGAKANGQGTLLSGSRPFSLEGKLPLNHHLGVSAFSQFTVVSQESLVKIDPTLSLDIAALFGCAVITGMGAIVNTAMVQPGTSVAIFGLGGVGLSSLLGANAVGANPIIAVDVLDSKLDLARTLGANYTVNAKTDDPIHAIKELTGGGVDYAIESVGSEQVLIQAYQATGRGGMTITIGLPHPSKQFSISAVSLVAEERTIKGSYMGSSVPQRDLPRFISMYQSDLLPVDKLLTDVIKLDNINAAFDALANGKAVRQIVKFT